jgi:NADPH2:quinone reductase
MKAAWYERNGPAREVLIVGDWETPQPGVGEVLVKLHASGVNPSDFKSRMARPLSAPRIIPHSDGAGVIEAVGAQVDPKRIGERVWIWNGQWQRPMGTCAEYIAVPAEQAVKLPENTSFEAGACLGIPALTAFQAVELAGDLEGKTVLITGAANGVGAYCVQMAKVKGATVIGTVGRADKAAFAQSIGVDQVIDYKTESVTDRVKALTQGQGVDAIIDMDFSSIDGLVCGGALKSHGTVVCYGSNDMSQASFTFRTWLYLNVTLKLFLVYDLTAVERLHCVAGVTRLLDTGRLTHQVGLRFKLQDIVQAHEAVEQGLALGNVVVDLTA